MTESPAAPLTPDICVIGAGLGGLSVATTAALFGVSVVLVERGPMGAERACAGAAMRALVAAGDKAQALREAGHFEMRGGEPQIDFAEVHDHVARIGAAAAPDESVARLIALGVKVIRGEARFRDRHTAIVGGQAIKARRFVIATGSKASAPEIPGLAELPVLAWETLVTQAKRPDRLIVLGGDTLGVELAQAMCRLGSEVTLVEAGTILSSEDPEAAGLVRRALLREGVRLHEQATILRAEAPRGRVRLVLGAGDDKPEITLEGTHLVLAGRRTADIAALELDLAGVTHRDGIVVNARLRTANRKIYAIGDCLEGSAHLGQVASHQAGLVVRNALFRSAARADAAVIPRATFSRPELAGVGLSEAQARTRRGGITVLRWPFSGSDGARARRESEGFVKLVTDRKGHILGVTIVGAQAGELIVPWSMAVQQGMNVKEISELVVPYASLSETSKRAAMSFYAPLAANPRIRRLIGFLRRFG